jgi:hypothetical protein
MNNAKASEPGVDSLICIAAQQRIGGRDATK